MVRFGRWTIDDAVATSAKCGDKVSARCDCGTEKLVRFEHISRGRSKSCGCLHRDLLRARLLKHGESMQKTPEYTAWLLLRDRCRNPRNTFYSDYGGRGITVCKRWDTYENFLQDMGRRPSAKHSIERKDNNGSYSPENCVWATPQEQGANKRNNVHVTVDGVTHTVAEWSRISGIRYATLLMRVRAGWSADRLLSPVRGG